MLYRVTSHEQYSNSQRSWWYVPPMPLYDDTQCDRHNTMYARLLHHENKKSLMSTSFIELVINRGNCQKERSIFTLVSYVALWDLNYRQTYFHIWIRVSERLLFIAHSAISWRKQVNFQWDDDQIHWSNFPRIDILPHSNTLSWFRANQYLLFLPKYACLEEKQQIPIELCRFARIHDILHSKRAQYPLHHRCGSYEFDTAHAQM